MYNMIDQNIMMQVAREISTPDYNKTGRRFHEIRNGIAGMFRMKPEQILLTNNIGITFDLIQKYFTDDNENVVALIPPNLGKETIDSAIRVFGKNWEFYDINKEFNYNEQMIKDKISKYTKQKKQVIFWWGTMFGVPVELSDDLRNFIQDNKVFVIKYMRDNDLNNRVLEKLAHITIYNFDRNSEIITNELNVVINNTTEDLMPLMCNGFNNEGKIVYWGFDMIPSLESQILFSEYLKRIEMILRQLQNHRSVFQMALTDDVAKNYMFSLSTRGIPVKTTKELREKVLQTAVQNKINLSLFHTNDVFKYYPDFSMPSSFLKLNREVFIIPFGSVMPINEIMMYVDLLKKVIEDGKK